MNKDEATLEARKHFGDRAYVRDYMRGGNALERHFFEIGVWKRFWGIPYRSPIFRYSTGDAVDNYEMPPGEDPWNFVLGMAKMKSQ